MKETNSRPQAVQQIKMTVEKLSELSYQRKELLDQVWELERDAAELREGIGTLLDTL